MNIAQAKLCPDRPEYKTSPMERQAMWMNRPQGNPTPSLPQTKEEALKELRLLTPLLKFNKINLCYAARELVLRKKHFEFLEARHLELQKIITPIRVIPSAGKVRAEKAYEKKLEAMTPEQLTEEIARLQLLKEGLE